MTRSEEKTEKFAQIYLFVNDSPVMNTVHQGVVQEN